MSSDQEHDEPNTISTTLIQAAQLNETRAWNRLDNLCRPLVRHWFQKECFGRYSPQTTDELVQNILTKAMLRIGTFSRDHEKATFKGWLFTIAKNESMDHHRRMQRPTRAAKDLQHVQQFATVSKEPPEDEPSELAEMLTRLLDVVREDVNDSTFEIFERIVVAGQDSSEVADAMGMKKSTVREAKRRVLKRIRDEWRELFGEWPFDHIGPTSL